MTRNTVPNNRPRRVRLKRRTHDISTRVPSGVGTAVISQLLPGAYTFESVTVAVTHPGFDQS
jgi:hypothetical protein